MIKTINTDLPYFNLNNDAIFVAAAKNGDLKKIKELLDKKSKNEIKFDPHHNEDEALKSAIMHRQNAVVRYFIDHPVYEKINIQKVVNAILLYSSSKNVAFKEIFNFFKSEKNVDIYQNKEKVLLNTIMSGHLDLVNFLRFSPNLKKHADINKVKDEALFWVVKNPNVAVVNYLLTSPDIKEKPSIYSEKQDLFSMVYNIDILKLLLKHDQKDDNYTKKNMHQGKADFDLILHKALENNRLEIMKYLLLHPDYKKQVDLDKIKITKILSFRSQECVEWFKEYKKIKKEVQKLQNTQNIEKSAKLKIL